MKRLFILITMVWALAACKKEVVPGAMTSFQQVTFTDRIRLEGHEYDSLLIENCTFDGGGLNLGDVDHVTIRGCTFKNINRNGLAIGFIGPCNNIVVDGCTFADIGYNGVDSHEDAFNCTIRNCTFRRIAGSDIGAAMGQPHHGIYWKGKGVTIEDNRMEGEGQNFGNGISVRSSGLVRRNTIVGFPKNGIMYYANHPGDDSLVIENNFLANNNYSITLGSSGNLSYHNKNVVIRFNSLIQEENYSVYVAKEYETTTNIDLYGNIIVNPSGEYLKTFYEVDGIGKNLTTLSDPGFVDAASGDLHLGPDSEAIDYCAGESEFPSTDIDGDLRNSTELNAGADE